MRKFPVGYTAPIKDEEGFYKCYAHVIWRTSKKELWQHRYWEISGLNKKETIENFNDFLPALKREIILRTKEHPDIEFQMIPQIKTKYLEI